MHRIDKPSLETIDKYFNQSATEDESIQVLEWLATDEGNAYYKSHLEAKIDNAEISFHPVNQINRDKALKGIYKKIDDLNGKGRKILKWSWMAAACVSILIVAIFSINHIWKPYPKAYATDYGEVKNIQLDDGSLVVLNANSRLLVIGKREIQLRGEAFFSVQHQTDDSPFYVRTDELLVNVLGTEFNVNSRRKATEVILAKGSIELQLFRSKDTTSVAMVPGDFVAYAENETDYEKTTVNTRSRTAWKNNKLVFEHTLLGDILVLLEDNYGLQTQIKDPEILQLEFTAEIPADDIALLLKLLEKSFELKITMDKNMLLMEKPS